MTRADYLALSGAAYAAIDREAMASAWNPVPADERALAEACNQRNGKCQSAGHCYPSICRHRGEP